ncbi:MAG: hypothetical protein BEN19_05925 [Epulopiscium sp. Nuni2H_MBin003]|nr:MAG: hypothetical protein BEN19_05925 [Epulopiscium sp. Nuni2H_MBin003]
MKLKDKITEIEVDALREVANIGAGNAMTALSKLLNIRVNMNVVTVSIKDISDIEKLYENEAVFVVANVIEIVGDMRAVLMLVLEEDCTKELVYKVLGNYVNSMHDLDEMEFSVLSEVGNILAGNYLNAVGTFVELAINQSTPQVIIDMAHAILSIPLIEFCDENLDSIFIDTYFEDSTNSIKGNYLFMLDKETEQRIVNSVSKYYV